MLEGEPEAIDRNWNELLQELRVTQTGLQILTGFLVTLPFQQRFSGLARHQRLIYMGSLSTAVLATVVVLAPASYHRLLFRQREKAWLVLAGNVCARISLALSGIAVTGVVGLLFDVMVGPGTGLASAAVCASTFIGVWGVVPLAARRRSVAAQTPAHSPRAGAPGS